MRSQLKADLLLVIVAMFWGASCLLTKIGVGEIQEFNLIALRFIIAFVLSCLVFINRLKRVDFKTIKYAAILGTILFIVFVFMTFGVKYTTVSNAGFLTCLAGIFIPIITYVFLKQKQELKVIFCIILSFLGIYLLTVNVKVQFNIGDLLCILCSLGFSIFIIFTGILGKEVDSISLGVLQLGFAGFYSLIFSLIFESPILPTSSQSWFVVLTLSILCTAFGFIVQTTVQKQTTATHTGLIFSLEPAFAAIFAFLFMHEILSPSGYLGEIILFFSILLIEIDLKKTFHSIIKSVSLK
jgi:drug/metabolite transporter (DMT)-like permease